MADEQQDTKKEQTEVFLDIAKSSYNLQIKYNNMYIRFCDRMLKILRRDK